MTAVSKSGKIYLKEESIMTALNVNRVTVDATNQEIDPISRGKLIHIQEKGGQIIKTRCGHYMDAEGLLDWAHNVIKQSDDQDDSDDQDQTVPCPVCRSNLMNRNFEVMVLSKKDQAVSIEKVQREEQQVRQERKGSALPSILLVGGVAVYTTSFLGYLIGKGLLIGIRTDTNDPLTVKEFVRALVGLSTIWVAELGMTWGGRAALTGGLVITAASAMEHMADKAKKVAQGVLSWLTG